MAGVPDRTPRNAMEISSRFSPTIEENCDGDGAGELFNIVSMKTARSSAVPGLAITNVNEGVAIAGT
jgi:hypothetical protein